MAGPIISGSSSPLTEEDTRKRGAVLELIRSENNRIADFAKQLVTVSFSAIGVVLALEDKWLGPHAQIRAKALLGVAIALFMLAGLLGTLAAGAYQHRVSLSDYADVDAELHRVARRRYKLAIWAFALMVLATIIAAVIAISS